MSSSPATRAVTIHMSEFVFSGLIEHGRAAGVTPSLMAQRLFEAGYAARCGEG